MCPGCSGALDTRQPAYSDSPAFPQETAVPWSTPSYLLSKKPVLWTDGCIDTHGAREGILWNS